MGGYRQGHAVWLHTKARMKVRMKVWTKNLLMLNEIHNDLILSTAALFSSLRKIIIKLNEKDYLDFLKASNGYNLTAEEKIFEIINYYIIIERKRPYQSES